MTLQQLRYFLAVVEQGGFSKAAQSLYISQPALSKQISLLEKSVNSPLFHRDSRGVRLTEKGEEFCRRIRPLVQELDLVYREMAAPEQWKVGALPSIASYYLPQLVTRISSHSIVPVVKDTSGELLDLVRSGALDAVLVQDVSVQPRLKYRYFFEEPYLAALPANHPLCYKDVITLKDVMDFPIVLHQAPCDIRSSLQKTFEQESMQPVIAFEASHNESLLGLTAAGAGISFVPHMETVHVAYKNIVYRHIDREPLRRQIGMFARSDDILQRMYEAAPDILGNEG